ncbi:thiamine biosynthetic bifunctional enzyme [Lodderomyces elongisporus]|uniref:thiamine biosynthetic bifunctional enzyme n=1 Tax=Lodderomyces elongisporus TaxID=36914 RepID=UPI00292230E5|nr:thiamine biosynthetic bifunctional enzyme [Lodderomyces elongisporus]WLF78245.1 thiamine biosynthetic bifunctional enzyme [Lodderomyces elongisporus]
MSELNDDLFKLYLVTDSTMIPESKTFLGQIEEAVNNGVTIVQLREKKLSTREFIKRAQQVHALTKPRGIPLIINDRVDVALAIDAEGVHVGQDDMPATSVRELIGPNKILGVTCSTPEEAQEVVDQDVADYVGLGTVYATNTKKDVTNPDGVGPIGIKSMLLVLAKHKRDIKSVAIGGINHSNAKFVQSACRVPGRSISGPAVVSCIMASQDAGNATKKLKEILEYCLKERGVDTIGTEQHQRNQDSFSDFRVTGAYKQKNKLKTLVQSHPLVHHITNNVVKNFSANVTLAIGASPIMSELPTEFEEFTSKIPNLALVLNLGTPNEELMKVFAKAISAYNMYNKPIVFDPVACGASQARLSCCRKLLNTGHMTVIKGNLGEIVSIWKLTQCYNSLNLGDDLMHGVDSVADVSEDILFKIASDILYDFNATLVITGQVNYVFATDGKRYEKIAGGSSLMSLVTGTGCSLGSVIAAFLAARADGLNDGEIDNVEKNEKNTISQSNSCDNYSCVVAAVSLYNEAGRNAASKTSAPSSFMTAFIDELYKLTHERLET